MALDLWLKEDIANIILAAERASASTAFALGELAGDEEKLRAYRRGYRDALHVLALAFGIETPGIEVFEPGGDGRRLRLPARGQGW